VQNNIDTRELTIEKLEEIYIEFNKEVENNHKLKDEARSWFKKLEDGDKKAREIWEKVKGLSMNEFERIYDVLNVKIDNTYGESFYEDKMQSVIKEVREKGMSKESEGAEIVEFNKLPPAMLIKSDGATTYFARDLATIKYRLKKWSPIKIIYEVGAEQSLHFRQVFEATKRLGWANDVELVHVPHGLVKDEGGKKMSTRVGSTIKLEKILDESIKKAMQIIESSETGENLNEMKKQEIARSVGIGAIKYYDLLHQPKTDIIFGWDKIFMLEGNSAPYLQYTNARINSIVSNSKESVFIDDIKEVENEEKQVLRSLPKFKDVLVDSAFNYSPNLLCNYLFDLAQKYNYFYSKHKIIGSNNENFRVGLSKATGIILKRGLMILGIDAPEKM
jgi:arginyl-tRNA synthetase